MENSILTSLISRYESKAFTNNYIFGFIYKGFVYMYKSEGLTFGTVLDKSSAKNGLSYSIRFVPTSAEKANLVYSGSVEILGTEKDFLAEVKDSKYNKGEIFEKWVTEHFQQEWKKDKVPFYEGADLTADKPYSIKFQKATICTEATLNRIGA